MDSDLSRWIELWDKARKTEEFKDTEDHVPSPQVSDPSFFGPTSAASTPEVRDCDAKYWKDLYDLSQPELLQESNKEILKKSADAIARAPNPIRPSSVGQDQELSPGSLGMTFSEKDIEKLTQLKLELHELTSKLASFDVEGKAGKKLETKIQSLKKQIDELSDELNQSLGEKKSAPGIEIATDRA